MEKKQWYEVCLQTEKTVRVFAIDEEDAKDKAERKANKIVHRYYISTAGWSGNETIIRAMQKNIMMWQLNWVQSRRGGHYIFELKEFNDER